MKEYYLIISSAEKLQKVKKVVKTKNGRFNLL